MTKCLKPVGKSSADRSWHSGGASRNQRTGRKARARRRGGHSSRRGELSHGIFPKAGNHLQRHQAQSEPSLDRPSPKKRRDQIVIFYERGCHARPARPAWRARIGVFAINPPKQPKKVAPKPAAPGETIGPFDQMIGQDRSRARIAVAGATLLIAENAVQLGPLRINIAAVQAIDGDRRVDQDAAANGVDSEGKNRGPCRSSDFAAPDCRQIGKARRGESNCRT